MRSSRDTGKKGKIDQSERPPSKAYLTHTAQGVGFTDVIGDFK